MVTPEEVFAHLRRPPSGLALDARYGVEKGTFEFLARCFGLGCRSIGVQGGVRGPFTAWRNLGLRGRGGSGTVRSCAANTHEQEICSWHE